MSFSGEEMFSGGVLLGSYNGSAVNGQKITIEAPASGPPLVGRYVLLQKDNAGLSGEDRQLHVAEFEAFGGCDTYLCFLLSILLCFSPKIVSNGCTLVVNI